MKKKICPKCRKRPSTRYGSYCNPCQCIVQRAYYERHPESIMKSTRLRQQRGIEFINAAKNKPCLDCGGTFPEYVMDFHHRNPSEKLFTLGSNKIQSIAKLAAEIAKCDLVCSNCHRIRHHRDQPFTRGELQVRIAHTSLSTQLA